MNLKKEKKDYLDIKYDENDKPLTNFPEKLILSSRLLILDIDIKSCKSQKVIKDIIL